MNNQTLTDLINRVASIIESVASAASVKRIERIKDIEYGEAAHRGQDGRGDYYPGVGI